MAKTKKRRPKKETVKIGIIGGSGLYQMAGHSGTRPMRL